MTICFNGAAGVNPRMVGTENVLLGYQVGFNGAAGVNPRMASAAWPRK